MNDACLSLENLNVSYKTPGCGTRAVKNMSLSLRAGERLGIIGESGSGKTTTCLALMGLLGKFAEASGRIVYDGADLLTLPEGEKNKYRWKRIAIVFQNSLDVLNPVLTIGEQVAECIRRHLRLPPAEANARVASLLRQLGLDPAWADSYPNQLSGGMRQRVLIAMAISCDPELLIVDEPTTALDAIAKDEILELIDKLQREKGFTLIVSSHELSAINRLTDRTIVMYRGMVVEDGPTPDLIFDPVHPYTRGLTNSSAQINCFRDLWGIPQEDAPPEEGGCPFHQRCRQSLPGCSKTAPHLKKVSGERFVACNRGGVIKLLEGKGISKDYTLKGRRIKACRGVDIEIGSGEVVALVGESGSGKSTLAGILCGMLEQDSGEVLYEGRSVKGCESMRRQNGIQMTFQDSFSSIDGNFTVCDAIGEPLRLLKIGTPQERAELVREALSDVQLPADETFTGKKCFMLSGGQRQRVAIARSLVMKPKLLIADEISSMLDPSTQANILRLLKGLQNSKGFSMLYISHDISLVRKIADKVYVMKEGAVVEFGPAPSVLKKPREEYTKRLVACVR